MNVEYFHASKYGNGAKVAEEFKQRMATRGVEVSVHHIKDVSASLAAAMRGEETGIACSEEPIGSGVNAPNIKKVIDYLKQTNWSGDLSIECSGSEENIRKSVEWLHSII